MRQGKDNGWAAEAEAVSGEQHDNERLLTDEPAMYQLTGDGRPVELPAQEAPAEPFLPLTGDDWPQVRERLRRGLERFIHAVDARSAEQVVKAGVEMQAAVSRILLESCVLSTVPHSKQRSKRH